MTWQPPPKPDPHQILHEVDLDCAAGRFPLALAKILWFHEHALEYDPHLSAVRLSFAVGSWKHLADVFPPALLALQLTRDEAEAGLRQDQQSFPLFAEVAALN